MNSFVEEKLRFHVVETLVFSPYPDATIETFLHAGWQGQYIV